jgi:hypothetical protein
VCDLFVPLDLATRGGEHAALIRRRSGRSLALGAGFQFLLETRGLVLDLNRDKLPGNLVGQDPSDGLEFRELGVSRKPPGINPLPEFACDPTKFRPEFGSNGASILAHLCDLLQGQCRKRLKPQTS